MICTTLYLDKDKSQSIGSNFEIMELRLDYGDLSNEDIKDFCKSYCHKTLIATCHLDTLRQRFNKEKSQEELINISKNRLKVAMENGVSYIDLDINLCNKYADIISIAKEERIKIIRSYHNFEKTDNLETLNKIIQRTKEGKTDIIKIVTTSKSVEDNDLLMSLYSEENLKKNNITARELICFAMGEKGQSTRIECLKQGAPFTYCYNDFENDNEIGKKIGQLSFSEVSQQLYKNRKIFHIEKDRELEINCSKSYAQRMIITSSLCKKEEIYLDYYTNCEDNKSAIRIIEELGAEVSLGDKYLIINNIDSNFRERYSRIKRLNVGESGLCARLMFAIISALKDENNDVVITGEKTLLNRSFKDDARILAQFGVKLESKDKDIKLPITIKGKLQAGDYEINAPKSSQIISGLLMSLPLLNEDSKLTIINPVSVPYINQTVEILNFSGLNIENGSSVPNFILEVMEEVSKEEDIDTVIIYSIIKNQEYNKIFNQIPKDWSTTANLVVASAIFGSSAFNKIHTLLYQTDRFILNILYDANCNILWQKELSPNRYFYKNFYIKQSSLSKFNTNLTNQPDLFPIVSILACFCEGVSVIQGLDRLKNKESDREKSIITILKGLGAEYWVVGNILYIKGMTYSQRLLTDNLLKGGKFSSFNDHRMVMALKVAELGADSPIIIDNEKCVAKSCPNFIELFNSCTISYSNDIMNKFKDFLEIDE